jgi:hypothetical protein
MTEIILLKGVALVGNGGVRQLSARKFSKMRVKNS